MSKEEFINKWGALNSEDSLTYTYAGFVKDLTAFEQSIRDACAEVTSNFLRDYTEKHRDFYMPIADRIDLYQAIKSGR